MADSANQYYEDEHNAEMARQFDLYESHRHCLGTPQERGLIWVKYGWNTGCWMPPDELDKHGIIDDGNEEIC